MIRLFEAISKYDIYSKYNSVLDKKFKDRSLKSFIDSLKTLKRREKAQFLEEFYKKYPYDFEEKNFDEEKNFNEEKKDLSLKIKELDNAEEEKENEIKQRQKSSNNIKSDLRTSFFPKKYYDNDFPDPFKYNPNYNSIYKKIPSFKISPKNNEIKNLKKTKANDIYPFLNKSKNKIVLLYDNNLSEEDNNIIKNKLKSMNDNKNKIELKKNNNSENNNSNKSIDKNLNLPLITSSNIIQTLKTDNINRTRFNTIETYGFRDNHALRFSKYLPRKMKMTTMNNEVSYIEPHDYTLDIKNSKKIMDFGKMKSRNSKGIINVSSLDIPNIGKYYPKYTLVEDKTKNVLFSPFGINKKSKKNILHKMLGSYKVLSEYQTINNDKLFNDNDLIRKQLIINYNINP